MGREVRRVPADWEHPRDDSGHLVPLYDESFSHATAAWKKGLAAWDRGERGDYFMAEMYPPDVQYWEYHGGPPDRDCYRPEWSDEAATHYQMYETVSEGTPISPVMPSPEELARWLADNDGDAGAGRPATYEQWLRVCLGGYAPSLIVAPGTGIVSGVEGLTK